MTLSYRAKNLIPIRARKYGRFYLLRAQEMLGAKPSPSLNGLAAKLEAHFDPAEKGFFLEVGGNDGVSQSNTYHLERYYGWNGILVEPVPWLAAMARKFRTAEVLDVALGSFTSDGSYASIQDGDLVSRVVGDVRDTGTPVSGARLRPLSTILEERGLRGLDFLSLDVEGYEAEVCNGIDFSLHRIRRLLVETNLEVRKLPIPWDQYKEPVKLTHHDYYIEARDLTPL